MTTNFCTFNPFTGITAGVHLVTDGVNPRNQRLNPPHIACGPAFVAVEKSWKHPPLDREGRLREASLHQIEPISGGKTFEVLVPRHGEENRLFCLVDSTIPKGVKLKVRPEDVRVRRAVEVSEGARMVIWDSMSQTYLVEFSADNAEIDIWYETGFIARLVRRGDAIVQIPLTATEIAQERVWQFEGQLKTLNSSVEADMKKCHGIIAATVRLLRHTSDRWAEDVYVDFLVEQIRYLTEGLREEIRMVLLTKHHHLAENFLPGWTTNVVPLKPKPSGDGKARSQVRKRLRAEEDRQRTFANKGPSGGGGMKQKRK
jgi:hypothetical protein